MNHHASLIKSEMLAARGNRPFCLLFNAALLNVGAIIVLESDIKTRAIRFILAFSFFPAKDSTPSGTGSVLQNAF